MARTVLTHRQKSHKWCRLVGLLTLRKYGYCILGQLYYAFLVSAVIGAMDSIWSDFSEAETCQNEFISHVSAELSDAYSDAALGLATSSLNNTKCIMQTIDVNMPRPLPDVPLSQLPESVMMRLFGWISLPGVGISPATLKMNSTAVKVVDQVNKDTDRMGTYSLWAEYVGLMLAGCTIIWILATATVYTARGIPWRPTKGRWFMNVLSLFRIVLFYFIALLFVNLQAYAVEKACGFQITDVEVSLPVCDVMPSCRFNCTSVPTVFTNSCGACSIKQRWWWVDWDAYPNLFGILYILFILTVWILETVETRYQIRHKKSGGTGYGDGKRMVKAKQTGDGLGTYYIPPENV